MDFEDYAVKVGLKVDRYSYGEYQFYKTQVAYEAFQAGQQNKQAEIDALRSHLRTVLDEYYITDYYNPNTCRSAELLLLMPSIYTDDEVKIEIQELLK